MKTLLLASVLLTGLQAGTGEIETTEYTGSWGIEKPEEKINIVQKDEKENIFTDLESNEEVYSLNSWEEDEYTRYTPVKAYDMQFHGIEYTMLTDGQGAFYIIDEDLENEANYVALIGVNTDRVYSLYEAEFQFDYENWFKENENLEKNVGVDMYLKNHVINL